MFASEKTKLNKYRSKTNLIDNVYIDDIFYESKDSEGYYISNRGKELEKSLVENSFMFFEKIPVDSSGIIKAIEGKTIKEIKTMVVAGNIAITEIVFNDSVLYLNNGFIVDYIENGN